ncbi:MAG: hypothetical protein A4E20_01475 [Nitrospira sp. SG-bin2]|uniref:hypothetical protein n=1 Tax=Nitrospira cf. moscoviensis SBR1015 TaxID=96242 RepID=UPI000A0B2B67|nr:hypothetical protein [Nitrospira cf. moscoviensis SBR1015]OQW34875.1 MAG: hypothetical protein A4E20_01475 [Nitrospira sp. SG-bin2]
MPQVTINQDGTVSVTLDPQEQILASMVLEERGADIFTEVFQLWFTNTVKEVMNSRFARLSQQDQVQLLAKMSQVGPTPAVISTGTIPVSKP